MSGGEPVPPPPRPAPAPPPPPPRCACASNLPSPHPQPAGPADSLPGGKGCPSQETPRPEGFSGHTHTSLGGLVKSGSSCGLSASVPEPPTSWG